MFCRPPPHTPRITSCRGHTSSFLCHGDKHASNSIVRKPRAFPVPGCHGDGAISHHVVTVAPKLSFFSHLIRCLSASFVGGGVGGVFLTSVLMLMFWPTGWVMLRRLRLKLNHPSRTSRFPNVGESAMHSGLPLVCLSLYLGTQSLSCLVYEGVTDCALKNSGDVT